jgi:hypothetical protein
VKDAVGVSGLTPPYSAERTQAGDFLIQLLAAGLGLKPAVREIPAAAWPEIVSLAINTKTAGLLAESARKAGHVLPEDIRQQLAEVQADNLRSNLANLAWTIKASQVLEKAGIPLISFKGAVRAHEVYGRWDARASSDIDLLVGKSDYWDACDVLAAAGFKPLVSRASKWWHHHLGEAPFARTDGSGVIIDLHNSVQQPGGPFPAKLEDFRANCVTRQFGTAQLRTPSPEYSLLICAISYGKAVRSATPWLAYAHELALVNSEMSESQAQEMRRLAESQGLLRLYEDALSSATRLFAQSEPSETRHIVPQDRLVLSASGQGHKDRFSRTKWLWNWCDGDGLQRTAAFTREIWRICRRDARQFRENLTKMNELRVPADD